MFSSDQHGIPVFPQGYGNYSGVVELIGRQAKIKAA